jgi:hypothetical protein
VSREELKMIPVPESTRTFKPVPHHEIVDSLVEALGFRYIGVVRDEYAVSPDGMKMFGVLDLETQFDGCRFAIGIRNANDKSMRLGLTVGLRVFVCDNLSFQGEFTPVLAKHSKNFSIVDSLAIRSGHRSRPGVPGRCPMRRRSSSSIEPSSKAT